MIDYNDFKIGNNGLGIVKHYHMTCNNCGFDRGYKRSSEKDRLCRYCSRIGDIATRPSNVNFNDFIILPGTSKRRYRTHCPQCRIDKGYRLPHNYSKLCGSCRSKNNVDNRILEDRKAWIDYNDFIMRPGTSSRRLYRAKCIKCNKDRGYLRSSVNKYCTECASSIKHSGKIVSKETKQKMSDNSYVKNGGTHPWLGHTHSDESKGMISYKQREYCQQHGNQFKGHTHSDETKAILSAKSAGQRPHWKGRIFQYDGSKGKFKLRSSYELFYANWMDSNGIEWKYEPQYKLSNGKIFSPDFQLSNGDIIEIKGFWAKVGLEKWTMFCSEYPNINKRVLMRDDLRSLGMKEK